ncbi:rhodanese-like domain-containing protein [Ferrovibrio terrae]|jgi:rhodanese-related sulfurtransferase|uniref:rhodanese-like domain-containing protein n=1 Tax=Ferrovibrio terrae TaxID=2594003 RepID=UPI003137A327
MRWITLTRLARVLVLLPCLAMTVPAFAQTGETPATLDGAKTIAAADAKALLAKGAKVFDVRKKASFADGHIPGAKSASAAVNANDKTMDTAILGADKDAVIIIHGHGTDGWSAVYAVKAAVAAGFKNVNWLRSGWADWSASGFPVEN